MLHAVLIFIGGGLGATGRHFAGQMALRFFGPSFPYGTMLVNILGSLLMGLFIGWLVHRGGSENLRLFFATGLLGGFTTFSAYSLDAALLWQRGEMMAAFYYVAGTVVLCLLAVFAGLALAKTLTV